MKISPHLINYLDNREYQMGLHGDFYSDEAVYRADLETLWYQSWIFAGHTCELQNADDRIDFAIAEYTISIRKDGDSYVAEHHDSGDNAPTKRTVHCNEIEGYLFVSLAEQPDDFEGFRDMASEYMSPHHVKDLKVAHSSSIVEYGNWKLVLENNRECYHCAPNHPELVVTFPEDPKLSGGDDDDLPEVIVKHWEKCEARGLPSEFKLADNGTYRVSRIPLFEDHDSYTMSGDDAVNQRIIGEFSDLNVGTLLMFYYPNTWNHFLGDQVLSFRVLPISAQATLVTTKWLVHKDAVEGVDYDLKNLTEVWEHTNAQDKHLVEENQQGINSPQYEPGPYSKLYESGVIQFINWYSDTLRERLKTA